MITAGLERVIQMGKARAHTFTFGAGSVGRIPCPDNSFLIIHHFDYFHFIDIPDSADTPAVAAMATISTDATLIVPGMFDFGALGSFAATIDFTNSAATLLAVQAALAIFQPGWTVSLATAGLKWSWTFTTTTPGAVYNGVIVTFIPTLPTPALTVIPGVFGGGDTAIISTAAFLRHSTHQLEFRSTKGRNHFVIQEPVVVFPLQATPPPYQGEGSDIFYAWMTQSFYPKDCYLVHTEPVQINVLGVPPVEAWNITFAPPSEPSQENKPPVGYGSAGFVSESCVREVYFDGAGLTQQYLPLTAQFDNIPAVAGQYRGEFKVDVNSLNALQNPQNKGGIYGNFKTYPLINIDYVQVDMNYNEFVKASNG